MLITNNYIRETTGALHRNSRPFLERPSPLCDIGQSFLCYDIWTLTVLVWFYHRLSPPHHLGQNLSSPRLGCRKTRKEARLVLRALQRPRPHPPPSLFLASKLQTNTLTPSRLSFSCSRQDLSGQGEAVLYKQVLTSEWTLICLWIEYAF